MTMKPMAASDATLGPWKGVSLVLAATALLAGCAVQPGAPLPSDGVATNSAQVVRAAPVYPRTPQGAAMTFAAVIRSMEPVIESECVQRRRSPINCDFQFVVDDRPGLEPNAFHTLDRNGRPIIGFTLSLIAETQNPDELAFVVGHEASHHILNHIDQRTGAATAGAVILSGIVAASGADQASIRAAHAAGSSGGRNVAASPRRARAVGSGVAMTAVPRAAASVSGCVAVTKSAADTTPSRSSAIASA